MRLCRYGDDRLGVVLGEEVADVTHVLGELPAARYPLPRYDPLIANLSNLRPKIEAALATAERVPLGRLCLLSPVANPGKLVGAPVNYVKHLEEVLGDANLHHNQRINEIRRAGLFLKATSSLVGAGEGVPIIQPDRRTDYEVELAVVIGRTAKNVSADNALAFVAGYTIGLDITIRGPEERSMRKSPDGYSVLGPWLVTADELPEPGSLTLELELFVNSEPRQRSNTRDLIIGVPGLIEFATRFYTLNPGDVLFTGTPEGVGPVKPGDTMVARIASIGEMRVTAR
jgi:2-keto-4-pentenoate hydratase/2-oxohepta-3-ene-1,7-dioic acid hydratase in catechol pathway